MARYTNVSEVTSELTDDPIGAYADRVEGGITVMYGYTTHAPIALVEVVAPGDLPPPTAGGRSASVDLASQAGKYAEIVASHGAPLPRDIW